MWGIKNVVSVLNCHVHIGALCQNRKTEGEPNIQTPPLSKFHDPTG